MRNAIGVEFFRYDDSITIYYNVIDSNSFNSNAIQVIGDEKTFNEKKPMAYMTDYSQEEHMSRSIEIKTPAQNKLQSFTFSLNVIFA